MDEEWDEELIASEGPNTPIEDPHACDYEPWRVPAVCGTTMAALVARKRPRHSLSHTSLSVNWQRELWAETRVP